jgi:O-antigen/teichoic acid export membrane protein
LSIKISKQDIAWGYLSQILNSGINLLLLPFILTQLSPEKLGLWYNFISISALVMLLDFGFSITITRNVAYSWSGAKEILKEGFVGNDSSGQPHINLFVQILKVSKLIYFAIAIIALLLLLSVGTMYITKISIGNIAMIEYLPAWIIYIFAIFLNLYYSYWTSFLRGVGAVKEYYQVIFFSKLAQLIFSVIGLLLGYELLAVAIAYLVSVIISRLISRFLFYRYSDVQERMDEILKITVSKTETFQTLKTLWSSVYKQGLLSISNYMIDKSAILISTAYFGLVTTSQFGLTLQALGVVSTISNVFYNSYLAKMISYKTTGKIKSAYKILCKSVSIQIVILLMGWIGISTVGPLILSLIGSQTIMLPNIQMSILAIYVIIFNSQTLFTNFIIMDNKYPMVNAYIVSGIITILLQIIFANIFFQYGIVSIISVQLIVLLAYNSWKWPSYVAKSQNIKFNTMVLDCIRGYKKLLN